MGFPGWEQRIGGIKVGFWKAKGNESDSVLNSASGTATPSLGTSSAGPALDNPAVVPSANNNSSTAAESYAAESSRSGSDDPFERYGKIRSALGPGTVIQGKLSFDTPVRIDGKLSGEVFSSKALIVGPQGWIDAQIEVAVLVVFGAVKGNVRATERIELHSGARLEGDIAAPIFTMADGAIFNGRCIMGPEATKVIEVKSGETKNTNDTKATTAKGERPAVPQPALQ
jgi:cytoskeletal protein CcmA (bactofilin family)